MTLQGESRVGIPVSTFVSRVTNLGSKRLQERIGDTNATQAGKNRMGIPVSQLSSKICPMSRLHFNDSILYHHSFYLEFPLIPHKGQS